MKAEVLKPFTMGDAKYAAGQQVDLEEWRVERLVREGLVQKVDEPKPAEPAPAPAEEKPAEVKDVPAESAAPTPKPQAKKKKKRS